MRLLRLYWPFLNDIVNQPDAIIILTPRGLRYPNQLKAYRHPERIRVVPFRLDYGALEKVAPFQAQISAPRAPLAGSASLLCTVRRHVYYRGTGFLIRVIVDIPQVVLVVSDKKLLKPKLKVLAKTLGLVARNRFVGHILGAEAPLYCHACDVFCIPPVAPAGAFELAQIEASTCDKPAACCELRGGVTYVNCEAKLSLSCHRATHRPCVGGSLNRPRSKQPPVLLWRVGTSVSTHEVFGGQRSGGDLGGVRTSFGWRHIASCAASFSNRNRKSLNGMLVKQSIGAI